MEQNREFKGLLPQKDSLTLLEAARYVAERCGVEDMRAREALQDAFDEFKIHPISRDDNGSSAPVARSFWLAGSKNRLERQLRNLAEPVCAAKLVKYRGFAIRDRRLASPLLTQG